MRKSLLISTVSAIVLMSMNNAFADTTVSTWADLKDAVANTGGTIILGSDIEVPAAGVMTTYQSGTVIDGGEGGHVISAPASAAGTTDANFRFINFGSAVTDTPLEIKNITFKGGHYISSSSVLGGAIWNKGKIGNITGSVIDGRQIAFKDNYVSSTTGLAYGGAIYNANGTIGDIRGDVINNYAESGNSARGGAIRNDVANTSTTSATIGNIYGSFEGNHAKASTGVAYGGALMNNSDIESSVAEIGNITGSVIDDRRIAFKDNYAESTNGNAYGGAIFNNANRTSATVKIGNISGNFEGNHVKSANSYAYGGAIYNYGAIGNIDGSFERNYAESSGSSAYGGAIYNQTYGDLIGTIGNITGSVIDGRQIAFKDNYAKSTNAGASGGAIFNMGTIGDIYGSFEGNYANANSSAYGGAIWNDDTIGNITGSVIDGRQIAFKDNYAKSTGTNTNSYAQGGAIDNANGIIGDIRGDVINNYAESDYSARGGAIRNNVGKASTSYATIGNIYGSFEGNHAKASTGVAYGGALMNNSDVAQYVAEIGNITGSVIDGRQIAFKDNYAKSTNAAAFGGAIYNNRGTIGDIQGNFEGNYAKSTGTNVDSYAYGGAIYNTSGTIGEIEGSFLNNYVSGNEDSKGGAIYSSEDITIVAKDGRTSLFSGNYVEAAGVKTPNAIYMASASATLNLTPTTGGTIAFEDEIDGVSGYVISVNGDESGTVRINNNIRNANISLGQGNMVVSQGAYLNNTNNLQIGSGHMTIEDLGLTDLHFATFGMSGGLLTISSVDVDLANQTSGMISADNVIASRARALGSGVIEVENVRLLSDSGEGDTLVQFVSDNIAQNVALNTTEAFAPIYRYNVRYDATTGEFVFTRGNLVNPEPTPDLYNPGVFAGDVFMLSSLNTQENAVKEVSAMERNTEACKGRVWAMPFYSDDTLGYKNFYDVDSRNYGLLAGIDTRSFGDSSLSHVYTLFGGYNDGKEKYKGVAVDNKSWILGLKASVYSDNGVYGDAIVNYARHDSEAKTAFGSDDIEANGYGAALKGGYKHEFEKVNIDTSLLLSWQQVEGDDFTAASGAKMKTEDYSRISLMPQVKVGYDLNKVRPYVLARYNFVLDEDGSSVANDTTLPEIESKDYVEYGLGVETTTNSNHSGYAHVLRHDGGREGWSVTAGYRYNF